MDKEKILQLSREENEGMMDELEQSVEEQAAQLGKTVGIVICLLLVFLSDWVLNNRSLGQGAWLVYFAMEGSSNLFKYLKTKKRSKLVWAVFELFCSVAFMVIIILFAVL